MKNTFEKELEKNRILIYGILDNSEIKERIKALYPETKLQEGVDLYQSVKSAAIQQSIESNEKNGANKDFDELQEEIHLAFVKIRKAIRFFYGDDVKTEEAFFVNVPIPPNYAGWRALVDQTCSVINATVGIAEKMNIFSIDIQAFITGLQKLDELKNISEKEDGEAQQATQKKNELFAVFKNYCNKLRDCLDLFYEGDERQKLEEIGIIIK